jgi:hypothetical protein
MLLFGHLCRCFLHHCCIPAQHGHGHGHGHGQHCPAAAAAEAEGAHSWDSERCGGVGAVADFVAAVVEKGGLFQLQFLLLSGPPPGALGLGAAPVGVVVGGAGVIMLGSRSRLSLLGHRQKLSQVCIRTRILILT